MLSGGPPRCCAKTRFPEGSGEERRAARDVLSVPRVSVKDDDTTMPRSKPESKDPKGLSFGPYRVLGVLGRGGMGVVYRGEHIETGEAVAIKTVIGGDERHHFTAMRREIPALRRLRHPGIVRFIAHGESHGAPWVAMPLLRGRTLRDHIRDLWPQSDGSSASLTIESTVSMSEWDGAPPPPASQAARARAQTLGPTLTLMHRLCAALAYLHGEDLVHRDLKPDNVFLQDGDRPVLIDLGLALPFGGAGREELDIEQIAGTPAYMAPEQFEGGPLDARADLYALGCILYECVTGLRPFNGPGVEAYRRQHLYEPLVAPSFIVPDVPRGLEDLVLKLLEKRPEERIGYAADVAAALVALGATPDPEEGPPARAYLYRPTFKGRRDALGRLKEMVQRTTQQRRSGIALVRGESGMGKTRLVREVTRKLPPRGCTVLVGTCTAPGAGEAGAPAAVAAPLHPLRPALLEAIDRARRSSEEAHRLFGPRREILAPYVPELREEGDRPDRAASSSSPSERARARVIAALRDTLRALSGTSPVLLLLDDLQWADELTLGLLEALARDDGDDRSGLLVIGTCRFEEPRQELDSLARAPGVVTIDLGKLDNRSIEEMVAGMLAHSLPPAAAIEALLRSVNGNPFFVAEFLLTAIEEGILRRDKESRLSFDESAAPTALTSQRLPPTVAALLERRLELLDTDTRRLAGWAAVLGHDLDDELLLAGPCEGPAAGEGIVTLRARRILEEADGRLRFVHDKLREAAYQGLDDGARRDWHLRAGEAIRARHGETPDRAPVLAHHFAGAGLHARAGEYFTLAAEHAATVYAVRDALRFYPLALEAFARAGAAPSAPATFYEGFGDALRVAGQQEKARDAYRTALDDAPQGIRRARLHRKMGKTWERHHEHAEALACYALAESALRQREEQTTEWENEWLELQFDRTSVRYWQANTEALDELIRAIRPFAERPGAALHRAHYLHAMTQRDILSRRFVASERTVRYAVDCLDAFEQASRRPDEDWVLIARCSLGVILLLHDDLDRAEQEMYDALPVAEASGDLGTEARCLTYLTLIQRRRGLVDAAENLATRSLKLTEPEHLREYAGAALGNLAWCALRRGDLARAEQQARRALALWDELKLVYPFQWLARLPLCRVELERERLSGAVAQAEAVLSKPQQRLPNPLESALRRAVSAFEEGRAGAASRALRLALQAARNGNYA